MYRCLSRLDAKERYEGYPRYVLTLGTSIGSLTSATTLVAFPALVLHRRIATLALALSSSSSSSFSSLSSFQQKGWSKVKKVSTHWRGSCQVWEAERYPRKQPTVVTFSQQWLRRNGLKPSMTVSLSSSCVAGRVVGMPTISDLEG